MVDLGGGQDGPIEHGFSDSVFILPAIVIVSLSGKHEFLFLKNLFCSYQYELNVFLFNCYLPV